MQHSAIVKKDAEISLFCYTTEEEPIFEMWKLLSDGTFTKIEDIWTVIEIYNNFYHTNIQTPNEDCFLCIKFGDFPVVVRVGEPDVKIICYHSNPDTSISFKQINPTNGDVLGSGSLINLGAGFYHKPVTVETFSVIILEDLEGIISTNTLKLPYSTPDEGEPVIQGYSAKENFLETGLNMMGFLGKEKTQFDLIAGHWISSTTFTKAADLAKALTHKYDLEWTRTVPSGKEETQPKFIGNYIKYIKSQDEEKGRALTYKPYTTPETNANNFEIVGYDKLGNQKVKGLTVLLSQSLEILEDNSNGAIFSFSE